MELEFLGTGSGVPAKHRNVSSLALKLLDERNSVWLFDCGEATQHQILNTNLKPRKIDKIFITHLHGDHIFGLPGLISSRSFQGGDSELTIYGPKGIRQFIQTSLKITGSYPNYPLHIKEFTEPKILFEDSQFTVTVDRLRHGIPSYGFRIVEKDHKGSLDAQALVDIGVPFGPLFGQLKNGETITLEDGREINGADYIGPDRPGRIVTILGDTLPHSNAVSLAQGADVLVHEATFSHAEADLAKDYHHSTNVQAAEIAKKAQAERLILNHISARYLAADIKRMKKEARAIFPNTDIAYDLYQTTIPLKEAEEELDTRK